MFQKCVVFTLLLFLAAGVYLFGECQPYLRYWRLVWHEHGTTLAWFVGLLFADTVCVLYLLGRWFLLQETGRKLVHYEKQLLTGESVSEELARLVREGKR